MSLELLPSKALENVVRYFALWLIVFLFAVRSCAGMVLLIILTYNDRTVTHSYIIY